MKRRMIFTWLVAVIFSLSLSEARSLDAIEASGELKIGVPADYAPLAFYNDEEKLVGFDVDMAKEFANTLNLKATFVVTSWPTLGADLAADKYDIAVGGVTYTESRAKEFLLTKAIVPNGKIALAHCDIAKELPTLKDINSADIRVAVNPGGTNEIFVNEQIKDHGAQVIPVPDNIQNLQMIREKTADMMITDLIEGRYYEHAEKGVFCIANTTPFKGTESYKAYMVKKENKELLNKVDQWLDEANIDEIAAKWNIELSQ